MSKPIIKIPSKHIYSISDQKVIDNQIDKIEVQVKAPQLISATENVYNESVMCTPIWETNQFKLEHNDVTSIIDYKTTTVCAYINETPSYITKTFTIPKILQNANILRILTGADDNGQPNIKYSLRGDIVSGDISGSVSCNLSSTNAVTYGTVQANSPTNISTTPDIQYFLTPNFSYSFGINDRTGTATVEFVLENNSTVLTAEAHPNGNLFIINLTILNGLKIIKLGGGSTGLNRGDNTIALNGEYEEYIPKQVDVSFYGDIIKFDLQNDIVTINKDGNHIMSFNGNELMQDTNTPSVEDMYNKVIRQYKNGKECATIRCGIENFYTESDNITVQVLQTGYSDLGETAIIETSQPVKVGNKLKTDNGIIFTVLRTATAQGVEAYECGCSVDTQEVDGNTYNAIIRKKVISKEGENGLPMTFHIGDIVSPYVYGANNKDRPMSLYKEGVPKAFEVLGKKVIYDGGIWQDLTIQEYDRRQLSNQVVIRLDEKEQNPTHEEDINISISVIDGYLEVGDTVEFTADENFGYDYSITEKAIVHREVSTNQLYIIVDKKGIFNDIFYSGAIITVTRL